ncbi:DUF1304 family protein [Pedobacter sp. ISL-68]|uniref:DUF1304 family protein n=1 Tax=unclassified Pedobacter TaxID=2628915 RepID=UPI001BE58FE3|nr:MULTISPECIES: DUF1304 family protein [unclassified Pedobacter]MBT2560076.1 DUF1304 family protein [Pedobacter sp. ISL-64]MBT2589055.1 DUF1304 family protein [Pedobacter sp. ISL-68]
MEIANQNTAKLGRLNRTLVILAIIVHLLFFLLEAIFWMMPEVHTVLIEKLNNPVSSTVYVQALTLKNLFINQGFYNLFLVCAGVWGLRLLQVKKVSEGYAVLILLCFSAAGAGVVLALSTKAYILAVLQAAPSLLALIRLYPVFQKLTNSINHD